MRNRVDAQGREWLQPEWKAFIGQKLSENNMEYTDEQKKSVQRRAWQYPLKKYLLALKRALEKIRRIPPMKKSRLRLPRVLNFLWVLPLERLYGGISGVYQVPCHVFPNAGNLLKLGFFHYVSPPS
jgi:hypothetical protein